MIHESLCPRGCCAQRGGAPRFQRMPLLSSLLLGVGGWVARRGGSRQVNLCKFVVAFLFLFLSRTQSTPSCVHEVTHELPDACLSFFFFCLPVTAVHRVTQHTSCMSVKAARRSQRARHHFSVTGALNSPLCWQPRHCDLF